MGNSRPRYNQKGRGGDPNLAPPTATKRPRATSEEEDEILHQQEEEELQDATSSRNKKIKRAEAKQVEYLHPLVYLSSLTIFDDLNSSKLLNPKCRARKGSEWTLMSPES